MIRRQESNIIITTISDFIEIFLADIIALIIIKRYLYYTELDNVREICTRNIMKSL